MREKLKTYKIKLKKTCKSKKNNIYKSYKVQRRNDIKTKQAIQNFNWR